MHITIANATIERDDAITITITEEGRARISIGGKSAPITSRPLPALGAPCAGGFYAGPWPHDTTQAMIVSDVADGITGTYQEAVEHARAYRGGGHDDWRLFDRLEGLAISQRLAQCNAPKGSLFAASGSQAFPEEGHWTGEESQFGLGYAWNQSFGYGGSDDWSKNYGLRVRLVRIVPYSSI